MSTGGIQYACVTTTSGLLSYPWPNADSINTLVVARDVRRRMVYAKGGLDIEEGIGGYWRVSYTYDFVNSLAKRLLL